MRDRTARFSRRYGPWALVAGASEGLGRAFADTIAARGVAVALVARRPDPLHAAAADIRLTHGVDVLPIVADLGTPDGHAAIADTVGEREVGLVVANAAYAPVGPFLAVGSDET